MNKDRRKAIADIINDMGQNGALDDLDSLAERIEAIRDEEQEYLDNMPESLQSSDRAETAQAAVESLNEAADAVREMLEQFNAAITALEAAQE